MVHISWNTKPTSYNLHLFKKYSRAVILGIVETTFLRPIFLVEILLKLKEKKSKTWKMMKKKNF